MISFTNVLYLFFSGDQDSDDDDDDDDDDEEPDVQTG